MGDLLEQANDKVKRYGFSSVYEFNNLISTTDLTTPEKIAAFKKWRLEDRTKAGLLELPRRTPRALESIYFDDHPIWKSFD